MAEFYCECPKINFICQLHLNSHIRKVGSHVINPLFIEFDNTQKENLIKEIDQQNKEREWAKIEIQKSCAQIIDFTIKKCNEITKKLTMDQIFYNSIKKTIMTKGEIDKLVYEKWNFLSKINSNHSIYLDSIKKEIDSFFEYNLNKIIAYENDEECFWIAGNKLNKINLKIFEQSTQDINIRIVNSNDSCKISDTKFFIRDSTDNKYLIIDVKTNAIDLIPNILQTPNTPSRNSKFQFGFEGNNVYQIPSRFDSQNNSEKFVVIGSIKGFVYLISCFGVMASEKYDLTNKQWSKFASCPPFKDGFVTSSNSIGDPFQNRNSVPNPKQFNGIFNQNLVHLANNFQNYNVGGVLFDKLCVTYFLEGNPYIYHPETNIYTAEMVLPQGFKIVGHGYIITDNYLYQANKVNPKEWKALQYRKKEGNFNGWHGNSYVFKRNKYLFFLDFGYNLFQIDTELFEVQIIKTKNLNLPNYYQNY